MTKDEYLKSLKEGLEKDNVQKSEEIYNKYVSRFELAKEAGFTEEEAIEKFGSVDSIIEVYKAKADAPKAEEIHLEEKPSNETNGDAWTIILSLVADFIEVSYSDEVIIPTVNFNDANPDDYEITKNDADHKFKLEFCPTSKFFGNMHRAHINLILPRGINVASFRIAVVSSNVNLNYLKADEIKINTTSGTISGDGISCKNATFNMVSGNVNLDTVIAEKVKLNTVSGSLHSNYSKIDDIVINGVSGSVIIKEGQVKSVKSSVLSGKVVVAGQSRK